MMKSIEKISLPDWGARYEILKKEGLRESWYGGPLERHVAEGDLRLRHLFFDSSPEALRLWNFLLTEEERLHAARKQGKKIVGTMKDLGTIPIMAYALPNLAAFYPDGAWWIPCIMQESAGLLKIADSLGIDDSFCPVRAMLGAFINEKHFPVPDLLTCSVGAVCDDFSAIAQRLESLGFPIVWWEMPVRRAPQTGEEKIDLPGIFSCPASQVNLVKMELERVKEKIENLAGEKLDDEKLFQSIKKANEIRRLFRHLRKLVYASEICPLPSLEMQIAEMLAIHYCSDREETRLILHDLISLCENRLRNKEGVLNPDAVRIFWVNPVADLRMMNILEECGGRVCGTDYLFCHALDEIPEDIAPLEALARIALADPMAGSASERGRRIIRDIKDFGAKAVIISRIPGASHCALEGQIIRNMIQRELGIPTVEIETPYLCDSFSSSIRNRIEAILEMAR